jgi:hypothetical protein
MTGADPRGQGRKVKPDQRLFVLLSVFVFVPQHKWPLLSNSSSPLSVFLRDTQVCLYLMLTRFAWRKTKIRSLPVCFFSLCRLADKLCDQVSDAVLDACLKEDPNSKVACGAYLSARFLSRSRIAARRGKKTHTRKKIVSDHGARFFVHAETASKTGMVMVFGEITTGAKVDFQKVVRDAVKWIGFDDSSKGSQCSRTRAIIFLDSISHIFICFE